MQFKEQGGKVQVLLYTGFDEAKNAPIVRAVGSFDKYTYKFSPGLLDKLNAEQRDELARLDAQRHLAPDPPAADPNAGALHPHDG